MCFLLSPLNEKGKIHGASEQRKWRLRRKLQVSKFGEDPSQDIRRLRS